MLLFLKWLRKFKTWISDLHSDAIFSLMHFLTMCSVHSNVVNDLPVAPNSASSDLLQ